MDAEKRRSVSDLVAIGLPFVVTINVCLDSVLYVRFWPLTACQIADPANNRTTAIDGSSHWIATASEYVCSIECWLSELPESR